MSFSSTPFAIQIIIAVPPFTRERIFIAFKIKPILIKCAEPFVSVFPL